MQKEDRFRESDVKIAILDNKRIFGDIGESALVFEKAIMRGKTIMDAMICTQKRGVIGVEIKTERDTTARLNRQLKDYERVCDYVYVVCHDTHVAKVEQIIKRYKHAHVGIISYIKFQDTPTIGMYKEASKSPYKSAYHMLDVLWKQELLNYLSAWALPSYRVAEAYGLRPDPFDPTHTRLDTGVRSGDTYHYQSTKPMVIAQVVSRAGEQGATDIFCDTFICNRQDPAKSVKLRHFREVPK